jgi:hypothetical protein
VDYLSPELIERGGDMRAAPSTRGKPVQFPCHLFKVPGPHMRYGVQYKYVGCRDEAYFAELSAQGWRVTIEEAAGLTEPDGRTRDDLEREALALGIKFDGRTTDKKLAERIEEATR